MHENCWRPTPVQLPNRFGAFWAENHASKYLKLQGLTVKFPISHWARAPVSLGGFDCYHTCNHSLISGSNYNGSPKRILFDSWKIRLFRVRSRFRKWNVSLKNRTSRSRNLSSCGHPWWVLSICTRACLCAFTHEVQSNPFRRYPYTGWMSSSYLSAFYCAY